MAKLPCGDNMSCLGYIAWYYDNSDNTTHPVGLKEPNNWGLYDMIGNVMEWMNDWFGEDYYAESPSTDPQGPSSGVVPIIRGGAWNLEPSLCRTSARGITDPSYQIRNVGFRVCLDE